MKLSQYQYKSPFNFLDSYSKEDNAYFFGRDTEIKEVLLLFKKTNLVVLYGPSGSGKTSLAQCGLANKFYDWESLVIRRNRNIIESFFITITKSKDEDGKETGLFSEKECENLKEIFYELSNTDDLESKEEILHRFELKIEQLYENLFVIPFFIFDQFEELFIENYNQKEIENFSLLLSLVIKDVSKCSAVICIQEEFFTRLNNLKTFNPNILTHTYLVDDPDTESIRAIIKGSFEYFNINQVKDYSTVKINATIKERRVDAIIKKLKETSTHLPFLQIYLDKLYVIDFIKTYPKNQSFLLNPKGIDFSKNSLEFKVEEINEFGNIDQILTNYIKEINTTVIEQDNKIEKKGHTDTTIKFLKHFVSEKGTGRSIEVIPPNNDQPIKNKFFFKSKEERKKIIASIWGEGTKGTGMSISHMIIELITARILKQRGSFLELSHNYLIKIIKKLKVDKDILEYYKIQVDSSFEIYKKELENGRKPSLLQESLVKKIEYDSSFEMYKKELEDIGKLSLEEEILVQKGEEEFNDSIIKEKERKRLKANFWIKSKKKVTRNRNFKFIIIPVIGLILLVLSSSIGVWFYKNKDLKHLGEKVDSLEIKSNTQEHTIRRENSIKKHTRDEVKIIQDELVQIKQITNNKNVTKFIDSIQKSITTLSQIAGDTTIIRYYRRTADGNTVINTINSLDSLNFRLNEKEIDKDDKGKFRVNTIHYGKFVKKEYLDILVERLSDSITINSVKPFKNSKGYAWKNKSIEIGFEEVKSEIITNVRLNNEKYNIRMYSYRPNMAIRDSIGSYLIKEKYKLKEYPDWIKKPRFFSSRPTVFYYDKSTKKKAKAIKEELNNQFGINGVNFTFEKGAGFGIKDNERENTFILHYIDINQE